jgi:hypothetical protein
MRFSGFLSFLFTGKPFSNRELLAVRGEVSFAEAIDAHLEWKRRLLDAVGGHPANLPVASEVGRDAGCTLGRWIHGEGDQRYGDLSSFVELRNLHAHFHDLARQVVELASANRMSDAKRLVDSEFQQTSLDIIARIRHLSGLFGS